MRFKPGQEIVCVIKEPIRSLRTGEVVDRAPKYNEVVTCDGYAYPGFLFLKEYDYIFHDNRVNFDDRMFEPLLEITEIKEVLAVQPEEIFT